MVQKNPNASGIISRLNDKEWAVDIENKIPNNRIELINFIFTQLKLPITTNFIKLSGQK